MHTEALCYQVQTQHVRISFVNRAVSTVKGAPGQAAGMGIVLADGARFLAGAQQDGLGSGLRV